MHARVTVAPERLKEGHNWRLLKVLQTLLAAHHIRSAAPFIYFYTSWPKRLPCFLTSLSFFPAPLYSLLLSMHIYINSSIYHTTLVEDFTNTPSSPPHTLFLPSSINTTSLRLHASYKDTQITSNVSTRLFRFSVANQGRKSMAPRSAISNQR